MSAPGEHLDLDAIADLDAGIVDADEAAVLQAHLDSCPDCGRQLARLRTTRALLSALPADAMPADVADRVQAALPDEPPLTTVVPVGSRRRWSRHPSLAGLGAAAAAIALVAAIVIGATHSSHHRGETAGGADSAVAGAAPRPLSTNFPVISSGTVYTDSDGGSAVATLDTLARAGRLPTTSPTPLPQISAQRSAKAATTFSLQAVPVPAALRPLYDNRATLLSCVTALTKGGSRVTPLAVDFGRFTGGLRKVKSAPAVVILLPAVVQGKDTAFIVGPKCASDPSQDLYAVEAVPATG
jgi:hypothetical protein